MKSARWFRGDYAKVIYCITCPYCNKFDIGETGRRLGDRFWENLRKVERNDKDTSKPVNRHFNLSNHSKQHIAVCGPSLHLSSEKFRKPQNTRTKIYLPNRHTLKLPAINFHRRSTTVSLKTYPLYSIYFIDM